MKKILSVIVIMSMLICTVQVTVFAENVQNYEYILPMEFYRIERIKNGYIAYDFSEHCALYNLKGEKISDDYDSIGSFYKDDVAVAYRGGKYYVINSFGEALSEYDKRVFDVSEFVFVNLTDENEDGRPFSYFGGEFGVYNYWGDLLTVLPYEKFMPSKNSGMSLTFSGGRLMYKENDKWGVMNQAFQTVTEPQYSYIRPFDVKQCGVTVARKGINYGLINADGDEITDFIYESVELLLDDYGNFSGYKALNGERYTVFDKYGDVVLQDAGEYNPDRFYYEYKLIRVYAENTRSDSDTNPYLYGFVNTNGEVVIPIEHIFVSPISDGLISAERSESHWGYYDLNGNEVTDFNYSTVSPFSEDLAFVSSSADDVWSNGVINKSGEVVFNTDGWHNGGFYGGIAVGGSGTLIDRKGEVVIKNDAWKQISWLNWWSCNNDGCFMVSDGERYGVVRYKGYVSSWAEETVEKARNSGIIHSDKVYDYVSDITREDFCEMIYNYLSLIPNELIAVYAENPFSDTDNEHVTALNALGIIKGKSETEFAPKDLLTREEAATVIHRLLKTVNEDLSVDGQYYVFDDAIEISDWADESIQTMMSLKIMNGVGDGKFAPKDKLTTEQALVTVYRAFAGGIAE